MAFVRDFYNSIVGGRRALVYQFTGTAPWLTTDKFSFGDGNFGQPLIPNIGTIQAEFRLTSPGGGGANTLLPVFSYRYTGPLEELNTFIGPAAPYVAMGPFPFALRPDHLTPKGLYCMTGGDVDLVAGQSIVGIFTIFDRPGSP